MKFSRITAIASALILVLMPACDSSDAPESTAKTLVADAMAKDQTVADPTALDVKKETSIDVGDVEQAIRIVGVLSEISKSDNVVEKITLDGRDRIRAVNIEVNPPNPDSLWIGIRVDCTRDFVERPVVLDVEVSVEENLLDSFTVVLAANARNNMFQRDVEVLFGRDEIPDTLLVTMKSEALLLPEGTDVTVTDPYTVTEGQRTQAIAHTPVRIDFSAPGPKPSGPAATTETAAPAEPSDNETS